MTRKLGFKKQNKYMNRKFTKNLLGISIIFFLVFVFSPATINAQTCDTPTGLNTSNLSNFRLISSCQTFSQVDKFLFSSPSLIVIT